jgi:protein-S-isoprenylcysteine O-methyltransferase Ste14
MKAAGESFGARGEWWVVAQFILIPAACVLAVLFPLASVSPDWHAPMRRALRVVAAGLALGGVALLIAAVRGLGRNFTPNPRPRDDATLVQTGAYAVVRHPIYTALILLVLAFGLYLGSLGGLLAAGATFMFFDRKSRREETWLRQRYSGYAVYQQRTRKLIPFVY